MKNQLLKFIFTPIFIVCLACSDFGDINVNPNASESPLTSALFTNALSQLGGMQTGGANFTSGLYTQYFSQSQYTDISLYQIQDVNWAGEMTGSLRDFQSIIEINSNSKTAGTAALVGSNNNQLAVARIMKAIRFSILTDRYGDIPYFEALTGNTKPKYDAQADIYADLFKELAEAVAQFDSGPMLKGDILFSGNQVLWKKFANSFRLILALRVSKVNPTLGQAQFNDALNSSEGVISSNTENAELVYPGGAYVNPWFTIAADQGISSIMANFLNANGDQRRWVFGNNPNATTGNLVGIPPGLKREDAIAFTAANPTWSLILDEPYRSANSKMTLLTHADVLLARAEAKHLGWTPSEQKSVSELYNEGIRASWQQWGVFTQTTYDAYIADADIALTAGTETEKIATQRWVTFYPNGHQGWSEWRRTGFPVLTPTPNAVNPSKQIPVKFIFPSVEYTYNEDNAKAAAARMGSDNDQTKVWWDVN